MCRTKIEKTSGCNHMQCRLCSYQFCWVCKHPASFEHFLPISIYGCGVDLYQKENTGFFHRITFKLFKYLMVVLTIIAASIALAPCAFANLLHDEDRRFFKRNPKASLFFDIQMDNSACHFLRDSVRIFTIMEGFCIGLISDIVFTPICMFLGTISIFVGTPIMFLEETTQRNRIHRQAEKRLKAILERNKKLYDGITNDEQFYWASL